MKRLLLKAGMILRSAACCFCYRRDNSSYTFGFNDVKSYIKEMDLLDLRKRIDEIDSKLIPLFIERMGISKEVAEYKVKTVCLFLMKKRKGNAGQC